MKILPICYQSRGFLIIELLVALGFLATLTLLISKYQLQVSLYQKAAQELYQAVSLGENEIEELWAMRTIPIATTKQINKFTVTTSIMPDLVRGFYLVKIEIGWQTVLNRYQKIEFELLCLA